jgi:hypothetical protein
VADFVAIVIPAIVSLGGLFLFLWATTTHRQDARLAQLEADQRFFDAARLGQLEKQQCVDSRAFAMQARLHHQRIDDLDLRLQAMARDMVTADALARTWPATPVDRDRPTVRPAR